MGCPDCLIQLNTPGFMLWVAYLASRKGTFPEVITTTILYYYLLHRCEQVQLFSGHAGSVFSLDAKGDTLVTGGADKVMTSFTIYLTFYSVRVNHGLNYEIRRIDLEGRLSPCPNKG
eukprot:sb/3476555/